MATPCISGIGVVCALANDAKTYWQRLVAGETGLGVITRFSTHDCSCRWAGEVKYKELSELYDSRETRRMAPLSVYAMRAAQQALADAGLLAEQLGSAALLMVTTHGAAGFGRDFHDGIFSSGLQAASPICFAGGGLHAPAGHLSLALQIPASHTFIGGADTALNAVIWAAHQIQQGRWQRVLVGATEELEQVPFSAYQRLRYLASEPCCRPFGGQRRGTLLGEGAAFLLLEAQQLLGKRHAYATIEGTAAGRTTNRSQAVEQFAQIMQQALQPAAPCELIMASAAGRQADALEAQALQRVLPQVPVSAIRGALGECFATTGMLQVITLALCLQQQCIPPTVGTKNVAGDCPVHLVLQAQSWQGHQGLVSVLGWEGGAAALSLGQVDRSGCQEDQTSIS